MADRTGQLLGNYRLTRLLGQGGFADVYLGEHVHLNTLAAIKVLRTQIVAEETENFRTEARTIAHLVHPNIVRVLDFGVDDTTPFLVMEYAPNGTLRMRHPRGMPVSLAGVVSYVQQVAGALQYAHDQKLIHRDIKPENMLLGRNNEVLLSDFGIAVVTQSARAPNMQNQSSWDPAGTAAYMAPEQIQGRTLPASDQYGLAVVVYEWLTGVLPFTGTYMEVVSQQMSAPPPSLREKAPAISLDVEHVVLTALAKDPQRRFGRIQAFAKALEQAAQSKAPIPVHVIPSSSNSSQNKSSEVPTMEASLIGPQGRTALGPAKLTIGRAADNGLVINDGKVSLHHAEIRPEGQYYSIVDLGSTNKTFVNEQMLTSDVPRPLQQGDRLRFGDTTYAYEVIHSLQNNQNNVASSYQRTILASPSEGLPRLSGGNTNYGGGAADYSSAAQQEYLETLPSQQPSYMTPPASYMPMPPAPPASYMPTPSSQSYMPPNQPSSYGPPAQQPYGGGQQPLYTPNQNAQQQQSVQPQFVQPQAQFVQPQPQPTRQRSPLRTIILAVLACVIILGGIGAFLLINNNNLNIQHSNATATANTNANNAHATSTAHALATTNVLAAAHASATAIATSHYKPFTTLTFTDPLTTTSDAQWNSGSSCQFSTSGYEISTAQAGFFHECFSPSAKFGDFAYQVNMTINSGDCGGLLFRVVDTNNFYMMLVCVNGTYDFGAYINGKALWADNFAQMPTSTAIHQGTNQQNVVAVVVQGNAFNLYVNNSSQPIGVFTDSGNALSQGVIGLLALDNLNPTSVTYTNAELWT